MPRFITSAFRITIWYSLFGCMWILFSDAAVESWVTDVQLMSRIQTIKGWLFIFITATLLFLLTSRALKTIEDINKVDPLTHLLRHYLFQQQLDDLLRNDSEQQVMLIYVDIDDFDALNKRLGYDGTDQLLVEFANHLRHTFQGNSLLGRMGPDQFCVALWVDDDHPDLDQHIAQLRHALAEASAPSKQNIQCTIGVAVAPDDGRFAKDLLRSAYNALLKAKSQLRGSVEYHNKFLSQQENERRSLANDLKRLCRLSRFLWFINHNSRFQKRR